MDRIQEKMTESWLFLRSLVIRKWFLKSKIKDFRRKLMPTFCRKPELTSFYSSLTLPYTKLCHRQTDRYTNEIKYVRFRRYVYISFAIFFLRKINYKQNCRGVVKGTGTRALTSPLLKGVWVSLVPRLVWPKKNTTLYEFENKIIWIYIKI